MRNPLKREDKGFEAFPAVIVADNTDHLGKRLGWFALWLLILFFAVSANIQSARNGILLEKSSRDRSNLISTTERITRTLDAQSSLILKLQNAVRQQNEMLRKAGIAPVGILYPSPEPGYSPTPVIPKASPSPSSKGSKSKPKPKPSPTPQPKPTPSPSPNPGPAQQARNEVCRLTGVCL